MALLNLPTPIGAEVLDIREAMDPLRLAEAQLDDALAQVDRHQWRAAYIIYSIYSTEMWREGYDDDGARYTDFEQYIRGLSGRVPRMKVRWAQQLVTIITLYTEVMGMPQAELVQCSPSSLIEIRKCVYYDQKKREIKGYRVEGGRETVLSLVRDAGAPDARYTDTRKRVKTLLRHPDVSYSLTEVPMLTQHGPMPDGSTHRLTMTCDDLIYITYMNLKGWPDEGLLDLKRRLGCLI